MNVPVNIPGFGGGYCCNDQCFFMLARLVNSQFTKVKKEEGGDRIGNTNAALTTTLAWKP